MRVPYFSPWLTNGFKQTSQQACYLQLRRFLLQNANRFFLPLLQDFSVWFLNKCVQPKDAHRQIRIQTRLEASLIKTNVFFTFFYQTFLLSTPGMMTDDGLNQPRKDKAIFVFHKDNLPENGLSKQTCPKDCSIHT